MSAANPLQGCDCTGVGLRIKLAAITGVFEHAKSCPRRLCACGHKRPSHHGGECYGCTGPECDPEMRALAEPLDIGGAEGVVVRAKPLFYDGYCISHAQRGCEWCDAERWCSTCQQPTDSPGCSKSPGRPGAFHTVSGGVAKAAAPVVTPNAEGIPQIGSSTDAAGNPVSITFGQ